MSAEKLKEIALKQFSLHGYDGASLAMIADEVGIKKQSIYSHYKSKDDLFIQTFQDAVANEIEHMEMFFETHQSITLGTLIETFIDDYLMRYGDVMNTSFFMRTSFFPPSKLEALVKDGTNEFVSKQEELFGQAFQSRRQELEPSVDPIDASICFSTLLDGLFVEMLYGETNRLDRRKHAVRAILWHIIQKN